MITIYLHYVHLDGMTQPSYSGATALNRASHDHAWNFTGVQLLLNEDLLQVFYDARILANKINNN